LISSTWKYYQQALQRCSNLCGGANQLGGVAPLVVVPAQNLHHISASDLGHTSVKNAAVGIRDDVGRDDWVFGVREGFTEFAGGCFLDRSVDLFRSNVAGRSESQVGSRTSDGWNTHCVAVQLAF